MNGALGCAVVSKQDILTTSGTRTDEKEKGKKEKKKDNDGGPGTRFN
jgi:hypothetical protein